MNVNFDFIAERTLRSTSRLVNQGMWLLFLVATALMVIVRRSSAVRTGSIWILGCAVLALMASFALRDLVRKAGHRNTENRIVHDVKTFLESEPAVRFEPRVIAKPAPVEEEILKPVAQADFIPMQGVTLYSTSEGEPVVFEEIHTRHTLGFKFDLFPVLAPMKASC